MNNMANNPNLNILEETLLNLKKSNNLAELVTENPNDHIFCQVIDFNEDFTLVRRIVTDNGEFDGYSLIFTGNIKTISWSGELLEQLEILLEDCNKEKTDSIDKISNINISSHFFKTIRRINSLFGHISVYTSDNSNDFYFGVMKDVDEYCILMSLMGDKSIMDDKNIVLRLEDIGRIDFGGIYDESMLKLHRLKRKMSQRV